MTERNLWRLLAALALGGTALWLYKLVGTVWLPSIAGGKLTFNSDFIMYYEGVRRFLDDPVSLYAPASPGVVGGYLYPPTSVVMFLPFVHLPAPVAYVIFTALMSAAGLGACLWWLRLLDDAGLSPRLPASRRLVLALLVMALGPSYHNTVTGQVNTLVLLSCVASVALLVRSKSLSSAVALTAGILLKLYPVVLVVAFAQRRGVLRLGVELAAAAAVMIALTLVVIPRSLYAYYVVEFAPSLSGITVADITNQSAAAFIERQSMSGAEFLSQTGPIAIGPGARGIGLALLLSLAGVAFVIGRRRKDPAGVVLGAALLLVAVPTCSPLGWGPAYVFTLPVLLLALANLCRLDRCSRLVVAGCLAALAVPAWTRVPAMSALPDTAANVFYSRYLFASLALCGVVVLAFGRARAPRAPKSGQTGG